MAGSSLLVLLDDIAAVLDDVALMTKLAAKKTAGVLGDDLAVNAEKLTGVRADRELPVVWAVAKGSLRNKLILVPAALVISFVAPWLITPLLMIGGLYLCYEGFEKVAHFFSHDEAADRAKQDALIAKLTAPKVDLVAVEAHKIKGAIRTDFILSAEIIVLTLGIVADASFGMQVAVVAGIALAMTIGVYGLVASILKLDDAGLFLMETQGEGTGARLTRWFGGQLLSFAPWLMKALGVVGTIAMFMVGGGILVHAIHPVAAAIEQLVNVGAGITTGGSAIALVIPTLSSIIVGLLAGAVTLLVINTYTRLRS